MLRKPKHLGPEYAAQFQDRSIVAAYHHRPPYPAAIFDTLLGLIRDEPRVVLDVGCGQGEIARRLVEHVDRVDAVDVSAGMIERGRGFPGGDHPNLRWILGRAEDAPLSPPYALITAAASLHWMEWEVVFPRFRSMLTPRGCLALIGVDPLPAPWSAELGPIIQRYSTNRDYAPYSLDQLLVERGLFMKQGEARSEPMAFVQSVEEYLESFHARNGLSRDRMGSENAAAFDAELRRLLAAHEAGRVELQLVGTVRWGRPSPT